MKFLSEKQLISTVFALSLFNNVASNVFADALNSINQVINDSEPQQVSNKNASPANKVLSSDEPQSADAGFGGLFNQDMFDALNLPQDVIDQANAAANGEDIGTNQYEGRTTSTTTIDGSYGSTTEATPGPTSSSTTTGTTPGPTSSIETTGATPEPTSSTETTDVTPEPTSSIETTDVTSEPASSSTTTAATPGQTSYIGTTDATSEPASSSTTTAVTPGPTSSTETTNVTPEPTSTTTGSTPGPTNPTPGPNKPSNGIIGAAISVITSIFKFFWSHRGALWNFLHKNIITPTWNWIKNKWFS